MRNGTKEAIMPIDLKYTKEPVGVYGGKPVHDLIELVQFNVTEEETKKGHRKTGEGCPGSLGGTRCTGYPAIVSNRVTMIDLGDKWVQGFNNKALMEAVKIQDHNGEFPFGDYALRPRPRGQERKRERTLLNKGEHVPLEEVLKNYREGKVTHPIVMMRRYGWDEEDVEKFVELAGQPPKEEKGPDRTKSLPGFVRPKFDIAPISDTTGST